MLLIYIGSASYSSARRSSGVPLEKAAVVISRVVKEYRKDDVHRRPHMRAVIVMLSSLQTNSDFVPGSCLSTTVRARQASALLWFSATANILLPTYSKRVCRWETRERCRMHQRQPKWMTLPSLVVHPLWTSAGRPSARIVLLRLSQDVQHASSRSQDRVRRHCRIAASGLLWSMLMAWLGWRSPWEGQTWLRCVSEGGTTGGLLRVR